LTSGDAGRRVRHRGRSGGSTLKGRGAERQGMNPLAERDEAPAGLPGADISSGFVRPLVAHLLLGDGREGSVPPFPIRLQLVLRVMPVLTLHVRDDRREVAAAEGEDAVTFLPDVTDLRGERAGQAAAAAPFDLTDDERDGTTRWDRQHNMDMVRPNMHGMHEAAKVTRFAPQQFSGSTTSRRGQCDFT
jgi:hypothetical protein